MSDRYDPHELELRLSHSLSAGCINARKAAFKTCNIETTEGGWDHLFSGGSWRRLERKKKSSTLVGFWTSSWADVSRACGFSLAVRGYQNIRVASKGSLVVVVPPMLAEARGTPYKDGKLWKVILTYHVATVPGILGARLTLPVGYPEFWDVNSWFELPSYGQPISEFMHKMQQQLSGDPHHFPAELTSVQSVVAWQISPGDLGPPRPDARTPPPLPPPSGRELLRKLELAREKERNKAVTAIWRLAEAPPPTLSSPQQQQQLSSLAAQPSAETVAAPTTNTFPSPITPDNPDYTSSDDGEENSDYWKFEEFVICSSIFQGKSYRDRPFYPGEGNWKAKYGYYAWKRRHVS